MKTVTTLRVVWIEIKKVIVNSVALDVTTLRVVWIEIFVHYSHTLPVSSPPCGWCGLKSYIFHAVYSG